MIMRKSMLTIIHKGTKSSDNDFLCFVNADWMLQHAQIFMPHVMTDRGTKRNIHVRKFTLRSHAEANLGVNLRMRKYTFTPGLTRSKFCT